MPPPPRKTAKPKGKKFTPVGEPLNWTDADLDRLSDVTEEDKAAAKADWRRKAPRKLKRLPDTKKSE
jgi:hypothetical protein